MTIMTMMKTLMMVNSLRKVPRVVVKSRVSRVSRVKGRTVRKVKTVRRRMRKMRKMRQIRLGRKVETQIMKTERYELDTCN